MGGQWLQGIRGFGIIIFEKKVAYTVVERIVETSKKALSLTQFMIWGQDYETPFALERISLTQRTGLEKQLRSLVMTAQTRLRSLLYVVQGLGMFQILILYSLGSGVCNHKDLEH
jgi:membrane protein required for beta-lactamase induction